MSSDFVFSFWFISQRFCFHSWIKLPSSLTLKLRTCIWTLVALNKFFKSYHLRVNRLVPSTLCSLVPCITYILYLSCITLKYARHSWQVPRNSVGRALYCRVLPFFNWSVCVKICSFSHLIPSLNIIWNVFVCGSFHFDSLANFF